MAKQIHRNQGRVNLSPNYQKIYSEIIERYYPEKYKTCKIFLKKELWSTLDVININAIIFGHNQKAVINFNQKHRSYDIETVHEILEYQKKHNLNNTQLAKAFKLSRTTITKWKKQHQ